MSSPAAAAADLIVAAAIVAGEPPRLLAAQRSYPAELAGLWELPGGKVHAGERDEQALVRECREELGVAVEIGGRVGGEFVTASGAVLRVWWARVVTGVPAPLEHLALRWLAPDELETVPWLPADAPVVAAIRAGWPAAAADIT